MHMVYTWYAHGIHTVCTWYTHGMHIVTHGIHTVCTWYARGMHIVTHGIHMVCTWYTHGIHTVCTWYTHGMHMVYTWYAHGIHIVTHGIHMVYTWYTHGIHMVYTVCLYITASRNISDWWLAYWISHTHKPLHFNNNTDNYSSVALFLQGEFPELQNESKIINITTLTAASDNLAFYLGIYGGLAAANSVRICCITHGTLLLSGIGISYTV